MKEYITTESKKQTKKPSIKAVFQSFIIENVNFLCIIEAWEAI